MSSAIGEPGGLRRATGGRRRRATGGRVRRAISAPLAVVVVAAVGAILVAGCERESERYGRELQAQLAASGIVVEETLAWPPRGSVPHWVVEAHVPGDEAAAEAACDAVAATPMADGELPYLVRLTYEPAGTVECGWATDPSASPDPG